jgi:hypothetical protein
MGFSYVDASSRRLIGQSKYTLHIKAYLRERHLVLYVLAVGEDVPWGNTVDALETLGEMALIRKAGLISHSRIIALRLFRLLLVSA